MQPFISTIIPSVGRPSLLRTIESVIAEGEGKQEHEIIVINDSGKPLVFGLDWDRLIVLETYRRKQSSARNAGAAIAQGKYLHFLDDDDWMVPGWLDAFANLADKHPEAVVLYGGCRITDQHQSYLGQVNLSTGGNCASHLLAGGWIPVGTFAVRSDHFFKVGGFSPLILPSEETDLYRRLSLVGEFANTPETVMNLLRETGWETTTPYEAAVENLRVSREAMLEAPAAWTRLRASATMPYWRGRNLKAYMASTLWNLKARRWSTALSRTLYTGLTTLAAGPSWLNRDFWQALKDTQVPATADRAMEQHRAEAARTSGDTS